MTPVLEVDKVSKHYPSRRDPVVALRSLTLSVPAGGVFGLLGPNGAGKSTLLRIALGLIRPTSGECRLFGLRSSKHPEVFRRVGGLIETTRLYPFLTGEETLSVLARVSGLRLERRERDQLLCRVGLADAGRRRVGEYSLGMKQRLGVASAILGAPELIILDEPTNGLDPEGIQEMRGLIRELVDQKKSTIILSSHQLDEVQRLCDKVAIIEKGELVAYGALEDLLSNQEYLLIDAEPICDVLEVLSDRAELLDGRVKATVDRKMTPALLRDLMGRGIEIYEAKWIGRSLEELFIAKVEPRRNDS